MNIPSPEDIDQLRRLRLRRQRSWLYKARTGDVYKLKWDEKFYTCRVTGFTPYISVAHAHKEERYPIVTLQDSELILEEGEIPWTTFIITPIIYDTNKQFNMNLEVLALNRKKK